jgi:predicted ATPase
MDRSGVLDIRLFGQASASTSGAHLKFSKRATTLAMMAMLILRRGQPVARSYLAFTLFPDLDEEQALSELRRYLYLAGKALPPASPDRPWIVADADTAAWNDEAGAFIDVYAFEQLAQSESSHADAIEFYTGDLMEDVYDDWVVADRERLRATYLTLLAGSIERNRTQRNFPAALGYAHRLLAADSWREDVIRQLMAIRYASGDAPGALGEFDRFAKRLAAEMHVTPMPETIALRDAILHGRPLIGSIDRPALQASRSVRTTDVLPFVGRDSECAALQLQWDRAARGFGNSVFLGGEAGVGKTRLTGELARSVELQGGRVFSGTTSSPESSPYQSITEALRSALPVLTANPSDDLTLGVLARVFPELGADVEPLAPLAALAPDREAARLYSAFGAAIETLGASRPALIVFEDLHWASPSTIDALAAICRRVDRARVLIVGTYRDEEAPAAHPLRRLLTSLGIEARMTDLHVARLSRDDVERVAASRLADAHPRVVDRLYSFSEGNPLFLSEALAAGLSDDESKGRLTLQPQPAGDIADIVARRLSHLSEEAQRVAEIAAICGDGCNVDLVRDVAGITAQQAFDAFHELLDRRLVREAGARDRFDYVFTHHLIGTTVYQSIDADRRIRRHARVAHLIEQRGATSVTDVRELARHYDAAALSEPASRWYARAARDAAALYANDDAVALASRAIALANDPATRIDALLTREEASARLGNREAQAADLDELSRLAGDDAHLRCRVLQRTVALCRSADDRETESDALAIFYAQARETNHPRWSAVAAIADARFRLATGTYATAKELAERALPYLEDPQTAEERVEALSILIEAELSLGNFSQAEERIEALQAMAASSGNHSAMCEALMRAVSAAVLQQQFERAAWTAAEALSHYTVIGDRVGEARALSSIAMASIRLSLWAQARSANLSAAEIFEAIGDRWGVARAQMNLGMLLGRCGDLDGARTMLASARMHHDRTGDRRGYTASLINEGFLTLWQGRAAEAKELSHRALGIARDMDHASYMAAALANLGAAERDLGDLDAAIAHMNEGLAIQVSLNRMSDAVIDLADLALAYAMKGDLRAAGEEANRILAIDRSWTSAAIFPPYPLWVVACVLHWIGDRRADEVLEWSRQLARAFAASIDEPELRAKFEALPFFTALERVDGARGWPQAPMLSRA